MRKFTIAGIAAALTAAPALTLAMTLPASADSTPACQTDPTCFEPVVAVSQTSGNDFVQSADAALSAVSGQVWTRIRNSLGDGTQDWRFSFVGTVPFAGPGDFGFTNFDNLHYGGRPIIQIERNPFGRDTGRCANITRLSHLGVIQDCGTGKGQFFILTPSAPGLTSPPAGYRFIVNVRQASNLQHHLLVTAQQDGFGQVNAIRGINGLHEQMWSALP